MVFGDIDRKPLPIKSKCTEEQMLTRIFLPTVFGVMIMGFFGGCNSNQVDAAQSKQAGVAFLAENAKQPGIVVTVTGLQYQVLNEGTGRQPLGSDSVTVDYKGSLIDGKEFDKGKNISFPLKGVIPGWTEGLQLMKEGAKYKFFIPSELAYGENGAARVIPPNAALIFEVDLVKVNR
jgi:FKBP-type peptidyl-prolyl cis-trans isomerase